MAPTPTRAHAPTGTIFQNQSIFDHHPLIPPWNPRPVRYRGFGTRDNNHTIANTQPPVFFILHLTWDYLQPRDRQRLATDMPVFHAYAALRQQASSIDLSPLLQPRPAPTSAPIPINLTESSPPPPRAIEGLPLTHEDVKADHDMVRDILGVLPAQARELEARRQKMLGEMVENQRRLAEIQDEARMETLTKYAQLKDRRAAILREIQVNKRMLRKLHSETHSVFGDELSQRLELAARTEEDFANALKSQENDMMTAFRVLTAKRNSLLDHRVGSDLALLELEVEERDRPGSGSPTAAAAPNNNENTDDEPTPVRRGKVHRFDGLPQHLEFAVGGGRLECECRYKADEDVLRGACPTRRGDTHAESPGGAWVPVDEHGRLSPPHCYRTCQEHRCSHLLDSDGGWDTWHVCLNECVRACFPNAAAGREV